MLHLSVSIGELATMTEKVRNEIASAARSDFYPVEIESFNKVHCIAITFSHTKADDKSIEEVSVAEVRTDTGNFSVPYLAIFRRSGRFVEDHLCLPDFDEASIKSLEVFLEDLIWIDEADLDDHADDVFDRFGQALESSIE